MNMNLFVIFLLKFGWNKKWIFFEDEHKNQIKPF